MQELYRLSAAPTRYKRKRESFNLVNIVAEFFVVDAKYAISIWMEILSCE
jgi:hypothetical protein